MIAAEKTNYPVVMMCRVLGVSRTGFHNWERRAPSDRALTDAWLTDKIKLIHDVSRGVYGAPRIHAELRMEHGIHVGRKRVARLMKAAVSRASGPASGSRRRSGSPGSRPPQTSSNGSSDRPRRTCCGSLTSPTCAPARAGCTSPRCRTRTPDRSSGGRWLLTCARAWSSTRSRWRSRADARTRG